MPEAFEGVCDGGENTSFAARKYHYNWPAPISTTSKSDLLCCINFMGLEHKRTSGRKKGTRELKAKPRLRDLSIQNLKIR